MANIAITGAARGIAFELARQHVEQGDRVFALVRNPATADRLHALADGSAGKLSVHAMNVGDDASVKAGVAATGDASIDILYNVAGVVGGMEPDFGEIDWKALMMLSTSISRAPYAF